MFKNLKLIFSPKNKDIRKRIGFTLFGLLIFAVGTTIPVPGTEGAISNLGFGVFGGYRTVLDIMLLVEEHLRTFQYLL